MDVEYLVYRPTYFGDFPSEFVTGLMRIYFYLKRSKALIIEKVLLLFNYSRIKYDGKSTSQTTTSKRKKNYKLV